MSGMAINSVGVNSMSFARPFPAGAPGGGPPAGRDEMLKSTADLLGMTLTDIAGQAGVSMDQLTPGRSGGLMFDVRA